MYYESVDSVTRCYCLVYFSKLVINFRATKKSNEVLTISKSITLLNRYLF
jgi:hypothetical protein